MTPYRVSSEEQMQSSVHIERTIEFQHGHDLKRWRRRQRGGGGSVETAWIRGSRTTERGHGCLFRRANWQSSTDLRNQRTVF
ncbi:hypothetical protein V6N13_117641 [Hibiscus sabdariffa]|uniref:Uncharacterized protein n=1 Tax=Hibiscus sabdariffa TaxID=183260 RepID=A0ABR2PB79_9ROSI